uniref:HNH endonuclease signature motif containing protein n=1 Tax=Salmonella enterica TaxID=28901 RepID=UPI0032971A82
RAENPCPSTGRTRGACAGWEIDHAAPLCAGGVDHPSNLQWLRKEDHRFKTLVDVKECRKKRKKETQ